jgi:ribosomal protein S6
LRRDNLGVVENQNIAGLEQAGQIADDVIRHATIRLHDQHFCRVARLRRP